MSSLEQYSYFAPHAFEGIRQYGQGIDYDEDALSGIATLIKNELDMDLPGPVGELQIIYRAVSGWGTQQPKPDGFFHKAGWGAMYVPASELAHATDVHGSRISRESKGAIVAATRPVMEVQVQDPHQPLPLAFAQTLSYPAAQDSGFAVGWDAWKRYAKELDPSREGKRTEIQQEVMRSFMSAIVLRPRS